MVITGIIGLLCTLCGIIFLPSSGIGLIGVIPGALLLWGAVACYKAMVKPDTADIAAKQQSLSASEKMLEEDLSTVDPILLGKCPNCRTDLRLTAPECPRCGAKFGENSAWKPLGGGNP
jgi:hypothetical protein